MNTELRIWLLNVSALFISLTNIDYMLRFMVLIVTIGYTITKWYGLVKKDRTIYPNPFESSEENENK